MAATLEHLTQCLTQTLSPDTTIRIKAELTLGDILIAPGAFSHLYSCSKGSLTYRSESGLVLAQLAASQGADIGLRQMSTIFERVNSRLMAVWTSTQLWSCCANL